MGSVLDRDSSRSILNETAYTIMCEPNLGPSSCDDMAPPQSPQVQDTVQPSSSCDDMAPPQSHQVQDTVQPAAPCDDMAPSQSLQDTVQLAAPDLSLHGMAPPAEHDSSSSDTTQPTYVSSSLDTTQQLDSSSTAPGTFRAPLSPPTVDLPNLHPMKTRSQHGITRPNPKYLDFHAARITPTLPTEPRTVKSALRHPGWTIAMNEELAALSANNTWDLIPPQPNMNVVGNKWVYKVKLRSDGSLERLKARLVAKGFNQVDGIDFSETFSPVIKPGSIRLILTVAVVQGWDIRQLDVKNAFLHGFLSEPVYMQQPPGFEDIHHPLHVCKLNRAL